MLVEYSYVCVFEASVESLYIYIWIVCMCVCQCVPACLGFSSIVKFCIGGRAEDSAGER